MAAREQQPKRTRRLMRSQETAVMYKLIQAIFIAVLMSLPTGVMAARCLLVMSYHQGYEWNDGIERGATSVLENKCETKLFYMDTKRNKTRAFAEKKALEARALIESFKPDVVIASDDNASLYLVKPYYKDADLPFVFCGLNWTTEPYGYPYRNATGMVEVSPVRPLIGVIKQTVKEPRDGTFLVEDTYTAHKNFDRIKQIYADNGLHLKGIFVKTMKEWEQQYKDAQKSDFLVLGGNAGIDDWNTHRAYQIVFNHTHIFSVTAIDWMTSFAMVSMTKIPEEQGEWAADVALAIINGAAPSSIPIVPNRKWNTHINTSMLEKANIPVLAGHVDTGNIIH